jgi:hypothetical protein
LKEDGLKSEFPGWIGERVGLRMNGECGLARKVIKYGLRGVGAGGRNEIWRLD